MMDKSYYKVYIIESPNAQDILDKRKEGSALSEMLSLADIPNVYYSVADIDTLSQVFKRIAADISRPEHKLGSVILHFSMHGNEDGIGLTSGEFLEWRELYQSIKSFNDSIGYGEVNWAPGKKYGFANLSFSVCHGFNAIAMKQFGEASPYITVLGPTRDVEWSDSLIAFATFYHLTIHKDANWKEAVVLMNYASGAGEEVVFKLQVAEGLYTNRIPEGQ